MCPAATLLADFGKLKIEVEFARGGAVVRPQGTFDEDINFQSVQELIARQRPALQFLEFDLGHITHMSSCGVREWLIFMERIPQALPTRFVNVCERFVEQANMIPNMFGKRSQVLSFQAPYFCGSCQKTEMVLLIPQEVQFVGDEALVPKPKCSGCRSGMEFDSVPDEYFGFVRRLGPKP